LVASSLASSRGPRRRGPAPPATRSARSPSCRRLRRGGPCLAPRSRRHTGFLLATFQGEEARNRPARGSPRYLARTPQAVLTRPCRAGPRWRP
jgi:hypothetical protein